MNKYSVLKTLAIGSALTFGVVALTSSIAMAQPTAGHAAAASKKKDKKDAERAAKKDAEQPTPAADKKAAAVGDAAPAFELKDLDDKTVKLEDYKGKIVVLEWYNPSCPFVVKHHKKNPTFKNLFEQYNSKGVVFLAINSGAEGKEGSGKALNVKMKSEYKIQYPVLLDADGKVGKLFGAQRTPHMFVLGTDGKIAYSGAIDNNGDIEKAGDTNYVKDALESLLANKPVATKSTKPYGCTVKYAN